MFKSFNAIFWLATMVMVAGLGIADRAGAQESDDFKLAPTALPAESPDTSAPADPFKFDPALNQGLSLTPHPVLLDDAAPEKSWDDFSDGWRFKSHPGLWFAELKGTVGKGARQVKVDESFSDLFDKLDLGLATDFEVGKGPWSFRFNAMWQRFEDNATGPLGHIKADASLNFAIVDGAMAYKFFDKSFDGSGELTPRLTVEALGGARWTYLSADIKLKGGPLGGIGKTQSVNWVDPYVGLRGTIDITRQVDVALTGTIGGFDVGSKLAWSAAAVVEYRFTRKFAVFAGYKILDYDYDLNGFKWDVKMQGPLAGLTIRW